jgi:hypothetical protein
MKLLKAFNFPGPGGRVRIFALNDTAPGATGAQRRNQE